MPEAMKATFTEKRNHGRRLPKVPPVSIRHAALLPFPTVDPILAISTDSGGISAGVSWVNLIALVHT
jgi:hypothetical protein